MDGKELLHRGIRGAEAVLLDEQWLGLAESNLCKELRRVEGEGVNVEGTHGRTASESGIGRSVYG